MANTNILAIEAAKEALRDDDFYKFAILKNNEAKQIIYDSLKDLDLPYIPSHTNFVFFKTGRPVDQVIQAMQNEGIQIGRPFPPLLEWARISTGTLDQVQQFSKALHKVLR